MARGRRRKVGRREKNGRIQRTPEIRYDKGTERAQAMQALYGPDGADAIGRAFRSGLLGHGTEAKAMLDMARSIANAYWRAFETGGITCTLGDRTGGTVVNLDHEKIRRREQWLNESLDAVKRMGENVRRPFYQLVIEVNPDHGPDWLDRLCFAQRTSCVVEEVEDARKLRAALDALEILTS